MVFLFSYCKHERICLPSDGCSATARYMPLAIGNYWIYEIVSFNTTTHTGTILPYSDTIRIIDSTFINGHNYFKIETDRWLSSEAWKDTLYWRDSIGYLVDLAGNIQFTAIDFDNPFKHKDVIQGLYREYSIKDSVFVALTPLGTFDCLDFKGYYWRNGMKDCSSTFHNYYSEDVGLVYQNVFYASGNNASDFQRSLIEYHIEK